MSATGTNTMIWGAFHAFGQILLSFLLKNDPEGFVDPVRTIEIENLLPSYDFIIVGAGSAGSVVASRLSENSDWNVLLVEAGSQETHFSKTPAIFPALFSTHYNWNYTTVPQKKTCLGSDGICPYPRGRSLGGSSATNGMIFLRGYKLDYERWGQDNPGWSFEDVHPFFLKSQDNRIEGLKDRGTDGPLTVSTPSSYNVKIRDSLIKAGLEMGMKNEECMNYEKDCIELVPMSIRDGRRCSASRAYLEPVAEKRKNLHILTKALVTKITTEGNRATGIEMSVDPGKSINVKATKEVVVSAGAIDSPKVLMLSGIGPKQHLESLGIDVVMDLPVGSYLQDHGYTQIPFSVSHGTTDVKELEDSMGEYVQSQTGPLSSNGFDVTAYSTLGQPGPPVNHFIFSTIADTKEKTMMVMSGIMRPHASGTVRLSSADPYAQQLIDVNFFSDQGDYDMQLAGVKEAVKLTETSALKEFNVTLKPTEMCNDLTDLEKHLKCLIGEQTESGHPVGTAKMGPKDKGGVVDNKLKVYGMENLRVIDASIAPYVISTNTNSMAIMIGSDGICPYPRGRSLGGSSATNGMIFLRGYKLDYERWGQDNPGWSFEDVHPFFLKSQDNRIEGLKDRGTDGPLTVSTPSSYNVKIRDSLIKAGLEMGMKNEECMNYQKDCIELVPMSIRDGRRCSASRAYLEPVAEKRKNLHILTNALVTKITTEGNRATGIEMSVDSGKSVNVKATKEVVVSAGAIDSPKVLMLSGIGPKQHLESFGIDVVMDLPVGSYLQDHGYTQIPFSVSHGTTDLNDLEDSMEEYVQSQTGPLSSNGFDVTAYSTLGQSGPPVNHFIFSTMADSKEKMFTVGSGIMRPRASGTVRLSSADPYAQQLIDVNFFSDQGDYDMQLAGMKEAVKLTETSALKEFNVTLKPTKMCNDLTDLEKHLKCLIGEQTESGHPVGTAKMGPKDKGGVVDNKLKVYGMENLRVIDASIAPYVISTNTNSMAIMIGEKGAHILKLDHAA
ncbi:hypothetical protein GE061_003001 [Apolygus lucorum]|uniref:Glucose-methanol-choline oxidoreductase N-terminal domain-containing protein n=1 Tax=Apolygus lucorum TaxID=248454 RepID=A0A6A4JMI0_APOLU|nr:hypothetical protein GE061_003001 [Apolygus lucorum]